MVKVLFVYYHTFPWYWRDGLYQALKELESEYSIDYLNLATNVDVKEDYDFYLGWGAFGSPADKYLRSIVKPKGLCIAGNAYQPEGANQYDVLFYETKWYRPQIDFHRNIVHAFGVNTDIYHQRHNKTDKIFDVLSVGSFALWKRQSMMKNKQGVRMVVGEIQSGNMRESLGIIEDLNAHGVGTMGMVEPKILAMIYNASHKVYIPANVFGGGERAIWEAKACGLDVEIESDNLKLQELVDSDVQDHHHYAKRLKKGIDSCL